MNVMTSFKNVRSGDTLTVRPDLGDYIGELPQIVMEEMCEYAGQKVIVDHWGSNVEGEYITIKNDPYKWFCSPPMFVESDPISEPTVSLSDYLM